jgi:hypothetical protein
MQKNHTRNQAVSEVVGEMLMIGLVLILAAVFTSQLPNYLPSERSPTVTIMMSNDTGGNVTLWHKGGDWVKEDTIKVVISNPFTNIGKSYPYNDPNFTFVPDPAEPDSSVFDLGGNITVTTGAPFDSNTTITLATDRAVLFSGIVSGGQP